MPLETKISAQISAKQTGTLDLGSAVASLTASASMTWASGTGNNQSDLVFSDTRTLTASSTENLDLAASLVDALGVTLTFAKVKAILIKAAAGNTNDVVVGGAASNAFVGPFGANTHTVAVKPGGVFLVVAPATGWTVTAATGDILKVANSSSGTPVSYDIIVIGTSV